MHVIELHCLMFLPRGIKILSNRLLHSFLFLGTACTIALSVQQICMDNQLSLALMMDFLCILLFVSLCF